MKNKIFEYSVKINESHLDVFGHVNNAVYAQLFDQARWDFITENGMGLSHIEETSVGPIVLEMNIKFIKEVRNRETLRIFSQVQKVLRSRMVITQSMKNTAGEEVAVGEFVCVIFDLKKRRPRPPTEAWLKACGVSNV